MSNEEIINSITEFDYLPPPAIKPEQTNADLETIIKSDLKYTHDVVQSMSMRAQQLVELALQNASDTNKGKDISVALEAINTTVSVTEKLADLCKKYQDKVNVKQTGDTYINNNILNITTGELLRQLKENNQ